MGTAPHTTVGHPGYCSVYHLRMPALLMWLMWPLFFCFKDSILGRWFATICASRFHPVFLLFGTRNKGLEHAKHALYPQINPQILLFLRSLLCSPGRPGFHDLLSRKPSFWDSGFHCHTAHPALSTHFASCIDSSCSGAWPGSYGHHPLVCCPGEAGESSAVRTDALSAPGYSWRPRCFVWHRLCCVAGRGAQCSELDAPIS